MEGALSGENETMSPEEAASRALDSLPRPTTVLVAVSGGADSVALLRLLVAAAAKRDVPVRVTAAHLDHGLRGEDAREDARFVRRIAEELGVRIVVGRARLEAADGSVEARARKVRYRFLGDAANRLKAGIVYTAHTLEDQAETVLDRLLRGTGIRGLRGILPERRFGPGRALRLRRPLLEVRREDLRAWLTERGFAWREDPTNHDGRNRRSRLRHELLPRIDEIGPGGAPALARVARQARESWNLIRRETRRCERRVLESTDEGPRLRRDELRACPEAVRWPIVSRWLVRLGQKPRGLGEKAIREAMRIALSAPAGTCFERPGRVSFTVSRRSLRPRRRP